MLETNKACQCPDSYAVTVLVGTVTLVKQCGHCKQLWSERKPQEQKAS